jgi:hypothetical protein
MPVLPGATDAAKLQESAVSQLANRRRVLERHDDASLRELDEFLAVEQCVKKEADDEIAQRFKVALASPTAPPAYIQLQRANDKPAPVEDPPPPTVDTAGAQACSFLLLVIISVLLFTILTMILGQHPSTNGAAHGWPLHQVYFVSFLAIVGIGAFCIELLQSQVGAFQITIVLLAIWASMLAPLLFYGSHHKFVHYSWGHTSHPGRINILMKQCNLHISPSPSSEVSNTNLLISLLL